MAATIKKTVIGRIARMLDLSQAEMPKLFLNDVCQPIFDIEPYLGKWVSFTNDTSTSVVSTGLKSVTQTAGIGKRYLIYAITVTGNTGVWTTNNLTIKIGVPNPGGGMVQNAIYTAAANINVSPYFPVYTLPRPLLLEESHQIVVNVNVDSYTSGSGTLDFQCLARELQ